MVVETDETKNSETKPSGTEAAKENDSEKRPPESDGKSESPPGQADVQPKEESDTKPQCPIPEFKTPKSPRSPVDRPRRGSKPRKSIHMMSVFNDIEVMRTPSPMSLADTFPKTRPRRRSSLSLMLQQDTPILPIVRQVELTTGEKLIIQPDGERPKEVPFWTSYRFRYAIIWFFGCICMSAQRGDLSIAIVSMVDHKYFYDLEHNLTLNGTMGVSEKTCELVQAKQMNEGEFRWNKEFQGFLLGSYFWGFLVLQVPGGRLAEKFGAKHVVGITTFLVAIISILSPIMARTSKHLFLISRIITGVCQGVMIPAAQAFWARWSPLNERSRLIGLTIAGVPIGSAVIFPVGGQLCAYGFDNGWASVFYVIGGIAFLWCIIWNVFIYNSPSECPHISEIELKYIEASLGTKPKHRETPWRAFLTSRALWAIIIAALCANFTSFMLATQLPTYMKDILKFDIASNGTYSMLPYLWLWFFTLFSVMCADHLIFQNILSVASTRKLMSGIGYSGGMADCVSHCGRYQLFRGRFLRNHGFGRDTGLGQTERRGRQRRYIPKPVRDKGRKLRGGAQLRRGAVKRANIKTRRKSDEKWKRGGLRGGWTVGWVDKKLDQKNKQKRTRRMMKMGARTRRKIRTRM
ncbi:sialin-like isoform X6 [Gigantopelta aegis]|uniref:sialin-like isoform X6 n=1 Tax=Gigantopelta aegis TaxID=1735272 RepID=UPI001B88B8B7|nr:sialin-like isoform X6 [Gigantopelta aegis]